MPLIALYVEGDQVQTSHTLAHEMLSQVLCLTACLTKAVACSTPAELELMAFC